MSDKSLLISPARPFLPQEGMEESISQGVLGQHQVVASRDFVNKVIRSAQAAQSPFCEKTEDMMKLAHHIEATQNALENLYKDGLAARGVGDRLLQAIVDLGQKFLLCHKELCRKASEEALLSQ